MRIARSEQTGTAGERQLRLLAGRDRLEGEAGGGADAGEERVRVARPPAGLGGDGAGGGDGQPADAPRAARECRDRPLHADVAETPGRCQPLAEADRPGERIEYGEASAGAGPGDE